MALEYVYLLYTDNCNAIAPTLMGCFKSLSIANSHFKYIDGVDIPVGNSRGRVLQKKAHAGEQIWYVEKHVLKVRYGCIQD